jgi:predicted nucleotidyltransferase
MKNKASEVFTFTSEQKILAFLCENSGEEFTGAQIEKAVGISRTGIFLAMRQIAQAGLGIKEKKGKLLIYSVNKSNPSVKQYKTLLIIGALEPLINILKKDSKSIVLYGSCARGEYDGSSDVDMFIISHDPETVRAAVDGFKFKRKIQAVIKTPVEVPGFKEKEQVYYGEVSRGITLWEEKDER